MAGFKSTKAMKIITDKITVPEKERWIRIIVGVKLSGRDKYNKFRVDTMEGFKKSVKYGGAFTNEEHNIMTIVTIIKVSCFKSYTNVLKEYLGEDLVENEINKEVQGVVED